MARILFIDDDPLTLRLMEKITFLAGHTALTASSKKQAFNLVNTQEPDLILVDMVMEEMSGVKVVIELRQHPKTAKLPIYVVSAGQSSDDEVQVLKAGANGYLHKPLSVDDIVNVLITCSLL